MKKTLITFFLIIIYFNLFAQIDSINQRIILIGDAGDMNSTTHPIIAWLKKTNEINDPKTIVLFLGDNIYPLGLPMKGDPSYPHAKDILDDQISLVKGKRARSIFIPGNHDWKNGKLGGWQQVINEEDYINSLEQKNINAIPTNGCPGPIQVELSDKVVVAIIDSQWFLFLHDKPGSGSGCDAKTIDEFQTELQEIANTHPNQLFIVAMHHPIYSNGPHGGDYTWKEHIFPFTAWKPNLYIPLPVLGSVYPIARGIFGSIQDIPHPLYQTFAKTILDVVKSHPYSLVVSGHDHGLQMIKKDSIPYIISGAGSELTKLKPGRFSLFSDIEIGFSMIEVWKSGKVDVKFFNLKSKDLNDPIFTNQLKTIAPPPPQKIDTSKIILDSVVYTAASTKLKGSKIQRLLNGNNYRNEWSTPVKLPVLDMGKENGGMIPLRQGGGLRVKTLRLQDKTGRQWDLRSIIKYPDAVIPPDLLLPISSNSIADGISASYPYGSLSMGVLCKAEGIPYLNNKLVYLPDDPRLTRFRAAFKNSIALMEERFPTGVKTADNTEDLILKLTKDNNHRVNQKAVLKARLLDNFVMDFDRNEDRWQWATRDTGKIKRFFPIPINRDQVFFVNQGLIPHISRKPWLVPQLQGFNAKAKNIKTFNLSVRHFDRSFLTELTRQDWENEIDQFLKYMTDEVIESALHQQPIAVQDKNIEEIIKTLKKRRNYFKKEMIDYYRFISRKVSVVGSDNAEQFTINKNKDGSINVKVEQIGKDSIVEGIIYERTFYHNETKEIRIFGMGGDDRFVVEGGYSPIELRLVGGSGGDTYINNGHGGKIRIYDVNFEKNNIVGNPGLSRRFSADPSINAYDRLNFNYDYVRPGIGLSYNVDDGLYIGPKLEIVTQGFRKQPYSERQYLVAEKAIKTTSFHFRYDADYIKVFGNYDILVRSDFRAPENVTNFFGIGNNSIKDLTKNDVVKYYRANYNIIDATTYVSRQLQSWLHINLGPSFQYLKADSLRDVGHFIQSPESGIDQSTHYKTRTYGGFDARLLINSKNNDVLPTRGATINIGVRSLFGLNKFSNNITTLNADLRIYMSLATQKRLVLATRFGWASNIGKYEFEQAQYLGETENLRGYLKQRFAGRSMLFNNTELRIKLSDFKVYLFPGSFGLQIFNDIGRVYSDFEKSKKWHDGYGAGIWLAPIKRFVVTASIAHSVEENVLPRLTFGFEF